MFLFKSELTILYSPFQVTFTLNTSFCSQQHTREAALFSIMDLKRFFWMVVCWVCQHRNNVGFKKSRLTIEKSYSNKCAGQDSLLLPCQRSAAIMPWASLSNSLFYLYRCLIQASLCFLFIKLSPIAQHGVLGNYMLSAEASKSDWIQVLLQGGYF